MLLRWLYLPKVAEGEGPWIKVVTSLDVIADQYKAKLIDRNGFRFKIKWVVVQDLRASMLMGVTNYFMKVPEHYLKTVILSMANLY